jgi:hypothetical protein
MEIEVSEKKWENEWNSEFYGEKVYIELEGLFWFLERVALIEEEIKDKEIGSKVSGIEESLMEVFKVVDEMGRAKKDI